MQPAVENCQTQAAGLRFCGAKQEDTDGAGKEGYLLWVTITGS